jgi:hypothetical protein
LRKAVEVVSFQFMKNEDNKPRVTTPMDQPPDILACVPTGTFSEDEGGLLPKGIGGLLPTQGMQLSSPTPSHIDERPLWLNTTPQLSTQQLKAIKVGVALIVLMGIFPPWRHTFRFPSAGGEFHSERPGDYYLIFALSKPPEDLVSYGWTTNIDFGRLVLQWVVVAVATFGGVFLLGQRKTE